MHRFSFATLLLLTGLAAPAFAQSADYSFQINSVATQFTWSGTTSIGDIDEQPADFTLIGTTLLTLQGGGSPVGMGAFSGGDALISPNITGEIPNPFPFLPPLASVQLIDAHIQMSSPTFSVQANGDFMAMITMTILQGTLIVDDINGGHTVNNLAGTQSSPTATSGSLTWSGNDYDLSMPVNSVFNFDDPGSGITGSITLVGTLIADHQPLAPAVYCDSLPNSSGQTGGLVFTGEPSLGAGNPTISASALPLNTFGIFFYGPSQLAAPFGNGVRCVGGSLQRLAPVNTGALGLVTQLIDNNGLPLTGQVSVGDQRNFQFWFRDVPAGASLFNLTDGMAVTYAP
ncbi:MAG: hypothetical protein ACI9F9_002100 [Candidatus Paceibacteria bacterium]|jgi:hypothetical protein